MVTASAPEKSKDTSLNSVQKYKLSSNLFKLLKYQNKDVFKDQSDLYDEKSILETFE